MSQQTKFDPANPIGHYSRAVVANGFVFVSGQLPIGREGNPIAQASFEAQVLQVLENLDAALESVGSRRALLQQVRVYITNIQNWSLFNAIYAKWLGEHRPARAVVPVPELQYGLQIEVEAVALVSTSD
jgi:reactive intermediate/imine deaminase